MTNQNEHFILEELLADLEDPRKIHIKELKKQINQFIKMYKKIVQFAVYTDYYPAISARLSNLDFLIYEYGKSVRDKEPEWFLLTIAIDIINIGIIITNMIFYITNTSGKPFRVAEKLFGITIESVDIGKKLIRDIAKRCDLVKQKTTRVSLMDFDPKKIKKITGGLEVNLHEVAIIEECEYRSKLMPLITEVRSRASECKQAVTEGKPADIVLSLKQDMVYAYAALNNKYIECVRDSETTTGNGVELIKSKRYVELVKEYATKDVK